MVPRGAGAAGLLLLLAVVCLPQVVVAQAHVAPREREFHAISADAPLIQLAHGHVDTASLKVYVDGQAWVRDLDYRVRARSGVLVPLRPWRQAGAGSEDAGRADDRVLVIVTYSFLGVPVTQRRDLRPVVSQPRPADDGSATPLFSTPQATDAWRTDNLKVSGSKTVQVASGSRRELTVDQNLRLNIVGQLTEDISVRAFLSDDNLPVVPEGNTEELQDIDKVLVELRGPNWASTLGDFVAERRGTLFGNYRRKLQGVEAMVTPGRVRAEVLAGSPRGRYRTLEIQGQESDQGPYYLGTDAQASNLFVVAGSERVTLDGRPLVRGADQDYVIDYVRGSVTFTYRRLITAESKIVVEFEEGEGPYGRTAVGGGAGGGFDLPLLGLPGDVGVRVTRERDDPTRLRTGELGPEDEAILAAAGDDPTEAVANGVFAAEPGEGLYDQQDLAGKTIYVYAEDGGDWNLELFYVGALNGDYALLEISTAGVPIYEHLGDGQGAYVIGRQLAMPVSHQLVTATASLGDTAGTNVRAEWDLSDLDQNQLSDLDDGNNQGQAGNIYGRMPARSVGLGRLGLDAFYSAQQASFRGFERHKTIFDYEDWGLADRARTAGFLDQGEREFSAGMHWEAGQENQRLAVDGGVGTLRHGEDTRAQRWRGRGEWLLLGGTGTHEFLQAEATDGVDPLDSERLSTRHRVAWNVGPVVPSAIWRKEGWEDGRVTGNRAAGFRLEEWSAGLGSRAGRSLSWHSLFTRGLADSLRAGNWELERDSRTATGGLTTGSFGGMRMVGEATFREVVQPNSQDETTRLARLNLSGRWDKIFSDWSLGYRLDSSRAPALDRQVVYVGEGEGDYNEDGDYVGPGLGDHDVVFTLTGETLATTSVQSDLQWRQGFQFLGADRWYGAWSLNSTGTIASRSTTDEVRELLLLNPRVLFDPENTVLGDLVFSEELNLLQHLRTVDLRGKFDYRQVRDRRFATDPEDRYTRNWQVNGNVNVSRRSSVRLRWLRQDESRLTEEAAVVSRRSYESLLHSYELGWDLRLSADVRLGLQGEYITRHDEVSTVDQKEFALRPTLRQRFLRNWTVQAELRWAEVQSEQETGAVRPWFYPEPGRNAESTLRLAWDPTRFLNVAVSWFTRKQGERRWQHDVRLESTARF